MNNITQHTVRKQSSDVQSKLLFAQSVFTVLAGLLLFGGPIGCEDEGEDDRKPLPDWSDGFEGIDADTDDVPDTDDEIQQGFTSELPPDSFGIGIPDDITEPFRLRKLGTAEEPCAVRQGTGFQKIQCVLERDELDNYLLGLTYDIVSPNGMCDFVLNTPYVFQNWPLGTGPTEVSYEVDTDGEIINEINSIGGVPYCEYDHSQENDLNPNCCFGSYTLTEFNHITGELDIVEEDWGGLTYPCLAGAAFWYAPFNEGCKGPASEIGTGVTYLEGNKGIINEKYCEDKEEFYAGTSAQFANFWNHSDHAGMPAAFKSPYSIPYYEILCTDDAYEWIAQIQLLVREWNEEPELEIDGNPDTVGWESNSEPIDDFGDWRRLTPGGEDLPRIIPLFLNWHEDPPPQ